MSHDTSHLVRLLIKNPVTPSFIPGVGPITPLSSPTSVNAAMTVTIETSTIVSTVTNYVPPSPSPTNCGESGPFEIGVSDCQWLHS